MWVVLYVLDWVLFTGETPLPSFGSLSIENTDWMVGETAPISHLHGLKFFWPDQPFLQSVLSLRSVKCPVPFFRFYLQEQCFPEADAKAIFLLTSGKTIREPDAKFEDTFPSFSCNSNLTSGVYSLPQYRGRAAGVGFCSRPILPSQDSTSSDGRGRQLNRNESKGLSHLCLVIIAYGNRWISDFSDNLFYEKPFKRRLL